MSSECATPLRSRASIRTSSTRNISGPEKFENGDALAFNQWRVTAEHRPLGEIMRVRLYAASAKVRRTLNHQPQAEPTSADEVSVGLDR
jgi:hypothetical protein